MLATVVRMLPIPAAMHLVGERARWPPRWLDSVLPDVGVEGAWHLEAFTR